MYWELHITLGLHPVSAKPLIEALAWKFSCINGDPDLGGGPREYATHHGSPNAPIEGIIHELNRVAGILKEAGFNVIRRKVELVMYDTKGKEK